MHWASGYTIFIKLFTAGGILIVSVGKKCKLIRWPPVFRCVCAFLFAHVLMIGTNIGKYSIWEKFQCTFLYFGNQWVWFEEVNLWICASGQILFYPFEDPLELLELDPQNYHQAIDTGTCEAVIYVGVRVQNKIHHLPDVVAATKSQLFCFRANGFL